MAIVGTTEFASWFLDLDDETAEDVAVAIDVLEMVGTALGHPRSSEIKGTRYALR